MQISTPDATNVSAEKRVASREEDTKLARLIAQGDIEAINKFCERYADNVYRYIRSLARELSDQDIEEIVQITMTTATARIGAYKGKSSLQTWLFSMGRHKLYDLLRQKQSRARHEITFSDMPDHWDATQEGHVESAVLEKEFKEQVRRALNLLPAQEAEVVSLRYMVGLGTDEIAQVIGKSERMTQKILTQARARLRDYLRSLVENE
ncbi:MAG: sigma-70 family RNA polymerase sigma factor [Anaerolineae bacterium]|nr:sigma-70 family RNA polymerase sigma factor [Thermoflexales bacterium]MDW8408973.1 sigma-70 family RNA polymerase sigma factor [Anaerolineae bacterium]